MNFTNESHQWLTDAPKVYPEVARTGLEIDGGYQHDRESEGRTGI